MARAELPADAWVDAVAASPVGRLRHPALEVARGDLEVGDEAHVLAVIGKDPRARPFQPQWWQRLNPRECFL